MNMNDYENNGPTIGEIHDLLNNDLWKPATISDEKKYQDEISRIQEKILDELRKEGVIPEDKDTDDIFVDPDDDEDLTIAKESSASLFWRMVVPNRRLIEIVTLEPTLPKITLAAKNNKNGCWVAFTSKRVAQRIGKSLQNSGIVNDIHTCDVFGNLTEIVSETINAWRPWHQFGDKSDIEAKEFFYAIDFQPDIRVFFVPVVYWDRHQQIYHGDLGIGDLPSFILDPTLPYCYVSRLDLASTKAFLSHHGFRENLVFQAHINEHVL